MCSAFSLELTHSHCIPVLHCKDTSVRFLFSLEWRQSKFEVKKKKNRRTGNIEDILVGLELPVIFPAFHCVCLPRLGIDMDL